MDGETFLEGVLDRPLTLLNDADAAGLAEAALGAARGAAGLVLLLTLGTGIGSAILHDGHLIPNTELGLTPFRDSDIERYAAPSVMRRDGINEREWAERFSEVVALLELLLHPDLMIVSGGITTQWSELTEHVVSQVPLVPARFQNDAGIIGASIAARSGGLTEAPSPRLSIT
jgi:polyphosphate glucokinase